MAPIKSFQCGARGFAIALAIHLLDGFSIAFLNQSVDRITLNSLIRMYLRTYATTGGRDSEIAPTVGLLCGSGKSTV